MFRKLNVNECDDKFNENAISSRYYRLEKSIGDGFYDVYDFHTVVNGNMYYKRHEEREENEMRNLGAIYPEVKVSDKNKGNTFYTKLLLQGYVRKGIYECDICGYSRRVK